MNHFLHTFVFTLVAGAALNASAADTKSPATNALARPADDPGAPLNLESYSPPTLPGDGLKQHPFLYAGQWDFRNPVQKMFIVRDGKITWSYEIPTFTLDASKTLQEFSDATLLSNSNIVFARKTGAGVKVGIS